MPACNERFSRKQGCGSHKRQCNFGNFAPVRSAVLPALAKPPGRYLQCGKCNGIKTVT